MTLALRQVRRSRACISQTAWFVVLGMLIWANVLVAQTADLIVTKSDGASTAVPGTSITYTIVVTNNGPDPVIGVQVNDTFPATLQSVTWTCSPSPGATCTSAGAGNIADVIDLSAGASVTYVASGTVDPGASGSLSNTASVTLPSGVVDPDPSNNSATDVDTLTPEADLEISKTDGAANAIPGTGITYTIVVSNNGPSHVSGAVVNDTFPSSLQGVMWTCSATPGSSCAGSGSGNIADVVTIRAGGALTYTVTATIDSSATGTLSNTASVTPPAGVTDPGPGANTDTDTDILTPEADLNVSKSNSTSAVTAGTATSYTIVVTNNGPSDAPGTLVEDYFPPELTNISWSCNATGGAVCAANGSGDIVETVNLPAGSSVTFQVMATVDPCASGNVTNTVDVTPDAGVTDPNAADNSSSDTDSVQSVADLVVSVADSPDPVLVCNFLSWEITVTNLGPSCADNVQIVNVLPGGVSFDSADSQCVDSGGTQTCNIGSLNPGDSEIVTITGLVDRSLKGSVVVDQTSVSTTTADLDTADNAVATSTDVKPRDPYVVSLTAAPRFLRQGGVESVNYAVSVANLCDPSVSSSGVLVFSTLPNGLTFVSASPNPAVQAENTLQFDVPTMAGGSIAHFGIRARLDAGVAAGTELIHFVEVSDSFGPGGRAAATVYVRGVAPDSGKLRTRFGAPRKAIKGGSIKVRVGIDNQSIAPAPDVGLRVLLPPGVDLVSATVEPGLVDAGPTGETELHWNFPQVARKLLVRVVLNLSGDFFPGDVIHLGLEATDGWGRVASTTRDIVVKPSP